MLTHPGTGVDDRVGMVNGMEPPQKLDPILQPMHRVAEQVEDHECSHEYPRRARHALYPGERAQSGPAEPKFW